jgi:hypothetical protein
MNQLGDFTYRMSGASVGLGEERNYTDTFQRSLCNRSQSPWRTLTQHVCNGRWGRATGNSASATGPMPIRPIAALFENWLRSPESGRDCAFAMGTARKVCRIGSPLTLLPGNCQPMGRSLLC